METFFLFDKDGVQTSQLSLAISKVDTKGFFFCDFSYYFTEKNKILDYRRN